VPVDQIDLYRRLAAYDDEVLWRILTVERASYRDEALAAAEMVLRHRGVTPPHVHAPEPQPAAQAEAQAHPKSRYQPIDFFVDVLLLGFLYWVTVRMDVGTVVPESWLVDAALRLLFAGSLTVLVMYLRHVWRTKVW
jgi:hypothetical protein